MTTNIGKEILAVCVFSFSSLQLYPVTEVKRKSRRRAHSQRTQVVHEQLPQAITKSTVYSASSDRADLLELFCRQFLSLLQCIFLQEIQPIIARNRPHLFTVTDLPTVSSIEHALADS